MKTWIVLPVLALTLAGCAGKTAYRENCADQLDAAWKELDLAKAEGFAGTVSYSKALTPAHRGQDPAAVRGLRGLHQQGREGALLYPRVARRALSRARRSVLWRRRRLC